MTRFGMMALLTRARDLAFANEAPLLVVTSGAIAQLNGVLRDAGGSAVGARHFRPNIVLSDADADADEARWGRLVLYGGVALSVAAPCARCSVVELDPRSGSRRGDVLRAIARRRGACAAAAGRPSSRITFGVFCRVEGSPSPHERKVCAPRRTVVLETGTAVTLEPAQAYR